MPRRHKGGFINESAYWKIGTDASRGRDGDTARAAARKYNDHRHPSALATSEADLNAWANELKAPSTIDGYVGGYIVDDNSSIRSIGDSADLRGDIFVVTSDSSIKCTTSGFSKHFDMNTSTLISDRIDVFQPIDKAPALPSLRDIEIPIANTDFLVGEGAIYSSVRAGNADVNTIGVAACAIIINEDFPNNIVSSTPPVISMRIKFDVYNQSGGLLPPFSNPNSTDNKVFESIIASVGVPGIANNKIGYEVQEIVNLSSSDVFLVRVTVSTDPSQWFTQTLEDIADDSGMTIDELSNNISTWLQGKVRLDMISLGIRHRATF